LGFGTLQFSGSLGVNDPFLGALRPSKSGLMNKHVVKHIVKQTYREANYYYREKYRETYRFILGARHRSGLIHQHIVKHRERRSVIVIGFTPVNIFGLLPAKQSVSVRISALLPGTAVGRSRFFHSILLEA